MGGSMSPIMARMFSQGQPASSTPTAFGTQYQAPAATPYAPRMQQGLPPSPLLQQIMAQQMQPVRGLGALGYMPQTMRPLPPMPVYLSPASMYRPNMAPAQASLGRVAVSVAEQQRRAAIAEAERIRAEQEARGGDGGYGGPALQSYYDSGGGG